MISRVLIYIEYHTDYDESSSLVTIRSLSYVQGKERLKTSSIFYTIMILYSNILTKIDCHLIELVF